jgi:hypothetical protein
MAKRPKRKPAAPLVPRLGPPENLRPAGTHRDKRRRTRAEEKAALRKAAFDVPGAVGSATTSQEIFAESFRFCLDGAWGRCYDSRRDSDDSPFRCGQ